MPKAASAAGTGMPVSGDHSNAMELASPVEEESVTTPGGDPDLGSHRDAEDDSDDGSDDSSEPEVPARLKGKSLSQVYEEFAGLEKDRSRLANEVGETRALLRQAIEMTLKQPGADQGKDDEPDVTDEDFTTDTRSAVDKLIDKKLKPIKEAVVTAEQKAVMLEFDKRHPGYIDEVKSPAFQDWVRSSPFRTRLFKAAADFDVEAAEDLFAAWEERKAAAPAGDEEDPAEKKREAIRRNKTETGGSGKGAGGKSSKKIYKSSELMRLYNTDRERYNAMMPEIRQAFAEGRVR